MTVSLELNRMDIRRSKKNWQVYFLVLADHPSRKDQMVLTALPDPYLTIVPDQNNVVHFDGGEKENEGLLLLHRKLKAVPGQSPQINVHVFVRHSREGRRHAGDFLQTLALSLGNHALGLLPQVAGTAQPWLVVARKAFPLLGKILANAPDRDLGFVSMYERFGPEFKSAEERTYTKTGGDCTLHYSWTIT